MNEAHNFWKWDIDGNRINEDPNIILSISNTLRICCNSISNAIYLDATTVAGFIRLYA